ncbi:hypothetical protein F385_423 [Pantoea agglomerans 299R]|nr:hypothetical protein F385_423 [Pantoea agglomerans 299R]
MIAEKGGNLRSFSSMLQIKIMSGHAVPFFNCYTRCHQVNSRLNML